MFVDEDAQSPFGRLPSYGIRLMKNLGGPPTDALTRPIEHLTRDFTREKPVSDEVFNIYKAFYAYDKDDLKPHLESVDDTSEYWRRERITYNAAYGNERILANLFLPKNAVPPYQTIIYFPHSGAVDERSSENVEMVFLDFIIRSGRALLLPVYKGTYERHVEYTAGQQRLAGSDHTADQGFLSLHRLSGIASRHRPRPALFLRRQLRRVGLAPVAGLREAHQSRLVCIGGRISPRAFLPKLTASTSFHA